MLVLQCSAFFIYILLANVSVWVCVWLCVFVRVCECDLISKTSKQLFCAICCVTIRFTSTPLLGTSGPHHVSCLCLAHRRYTHTWHNTYTGLIYHVTITYKQKPWVCLYIALCYFRLTYFPLRLGRALRSQRLCLFAELCPILWGKWY